MDAFGLPIVNEPVEYTERNFHRTTTGVAINRAGIPAMTVELGQHTLLQDDVVAAGLAGCYRVLAALEMIDAVPADIEAADRGFESPVEFPVKDADGPWTDTAGIVRDRLDPGEPFEAGDPIADVVDIHGERRSVVEVEADGYLLNRTHGAAVYENDEIAKRASGTGGRWSSPVTGRSRHRQSRVHTPETGPGPPQSIWETPHGGVSGWSTGGP